jgi:hypothetical protein
MRFGSKTKFILKLNIVMLETSMASSIIEGARFPPALHGVASRLAR